MAYFATDGLQALDHKKRNQLQRQQQFVRSPGKKPAYAGCEHRKSIENSPEFKHAIDAYERLKSSINLIDSDSLILTGTGRGFPIVHVSSGWVKMCGWSQDQVLGRSANINQGQGTDVGTVRKYG